MRQLSVGGTLTFEEAEADDKFPATFGVSASFRLRPRARPDGRLPCVGDNADALEPGATFTALERAPSARQPRARMLRIDEPPRRFGGARVAGWVFETHPVSGEVVAFRQRDGGAGGGAGGGAVRRGSVRGVVEARVGRLPLERKRARLEERLAARRVPWESGHQRVTIARDRLVESTASALHGFRDANIWRQTWRFAFQGEPGVDAGGVAREFWTKVGECFFDRNLGLFKYAANDNLTYQINPMAEKLHGAEATESLFFLVGRLLAKALLDRQLVTAPLNRPLLKHVLGIGVQFSDLEFVDHELHKQLNWILDCGEGEAEMLCLTFAVTEEHFGVMKDVPLKPGGEDIDVDDENKVEYVELRFKYAMLDRVKTTLGALLRGFYDVVPLEDLVHAGLDAGEFELLLCGATEIDVADWKRHTDFRSVSEKTKREFWRVVDGFDQEQRARLLQFVTGTARLPAGGFKNLQGVDGSNRRFEVRGIGGGDNAWPRAHTCVPSTRLEIARAPVGDEAEALSLSRSLSGASTGSTCPRIRASRR